ncbi:MAG: HIRAN domain-containing protein [Usitatibacter sp.]
MTLLMSCRVAGFQHHLGIRFLPQLRKGDLLTLRREPGNRHDPRAIRVEWRGAILGYVPREANFAAAQLMDRGTPLNARIGELHAGGDPRQRLVIDVSAESPVEDVAPPASHTLNPMVSDPQVPALVLAPDPPATGPVHEKAVEVLDEAAAAIARRLAKPPVAIHSSTGREVRLWESLLICVDAHGRGLKVAHLNDRPSAAPRITLDLRRPASAEHWLEALQPVLSRIAREHGLAAALGPMPLAHWMHACLRLTFQDFVDFEALRECLIAHLVPDPLARSLANRIFSPSPKASEFNWVCERVEALALLAVDAPRMVPYVHLLHADRSAKALASAEQLVSRLKELVPALASDNREPRVFRVLSRPPEKEEAQLPLLANVAA